MSSLVATKTLSANAISLGTVVQELSSVAARGFVSSTDKLLLETSEKVAVFALCVWLDLTSSIRKLLGAVHSLF